MGPRRESSCHPLIALEVYVNTYVLGRPAVKGLSLFSLLCAGWLLGCDQSNTGNMNVDMSTAADMATAVDMAGPAPLNGCDTAAFVDRTATTAIRTVGFGNPGFTYSPKCILIAAGQSVTFSGAFTSHPLRPGVGANAAAGSPNNPIMSTSTGTSAMFTFPAAGTYPYNCSTHDGSGMNGVVRVQ